MTPRATRHRFVVLLGLLALQPSCGEDPRPPGSEQQHELSPYSTTTGAKKVIVIAIDSLHPAYVDMNALATGAGGPGNWLMPNVRAFVEGASFWPAARGHAPYATDMNHLNILGGTNSGLTGIIGVSKQVTGWNLLGAVLEEIHVSMARYPDGGSVETLLHKVKEGGGKTAFLANKGWVAEMYAPAPADITVTGKSYPAYLAAPTHVSWHDNPQTDPDATCDPESLKQITLLALMSASKPEEHPRDSWIANAAVEVVAREQPDFTYVLLGDLDHGQHFLGAVDRPQEWTLGQYTPPAGCAPKLRYRLVSRRNPAIYKEPVLDLIRDVDLAFGQLMQGLAAGGHLQDSVVVLVSDHAMTNHLYREGIEVHTDINKFLGDKGLTPKGSYYLYGASSVGALFWRPFFKLLHPGVVAKAKAELLSSARLAPNPETGQLELPWDVLDRVEMMAGRPDLGIDPLELYNAFFVQQGVWPDLVVFARNGWSLPSGSFNVGGGGGKMLFIAGHGAPDTAPVVIAVQGLGFAPGARCAEDARLADVAVTLAADLGVTLKQTVGKPLICTPQ
jgi:hypothetical protein